QDHGALDGWQPVQGCVLREIRVELGGEVRPVERQEAGFYMEAALATMHSEDAGRRRRAVRQLPERVFDSGDAGIRREQALDISARQHQGAAVGILCNSVSPTRSYPARDGTALGTESSWGPGGCLRPG